MDQETPAEILQRHEYKVHSLGFAPDIGGQLRVEHEEQKIPGDPDFEIRRGLAERNILEVLRLHPHAFGEVVAHNITVQEVGQGFLKITHDMRIGRK
jgi:hypothetical protein